MISLHTLRPSQTRSRPKRVGRGNASGKGTTAGRGTKGQRARTGGRKQLIRRGFKQLTARTPKIRGFRSRRPKLWVVSLTSLERTFPDGAQVKPEQMVTAGLIPDRFPGVKILGRTPMKKKLSVQADRFSATAAEAIRQAGGQVVETSIPDKQPPTK